jgi:hypothetical protein
MVEITDLAAFVVRAKSATYVGSGPPGEPSRPGSHDLVFEADDWLYRDSYFGGTDFLGQETVWFRDQPVWAQNYYGYILRPDLIDATQAGLTIMRHCQRCTRRAASWAVWTGLARMGTTKIIRRATSHTFTVER